ncbi:MAG: response regulator [Sedimentibacter sp.]|nr:response regulator [Sedimentibacter sp.]
MLKVAIVDDEELVRRGLEIIISEAGRNYKVEGCYADGAEAFKKLLNADVDVLITDIRMPEIDGLELVKALHDMNINIPSIILTGYNDFEYARTALRYGVEDFLLKPVDHNEMFICLDRIKIRKYGPQSASDYDSNQDGSAKRVINEVKKIIENEYFGDLNLTEISKRVYLNPKYLSRLFKNETGINLTDYLIYVRINKAKALFKDDFSLKVYEVAEMVGYPDSNFFNKLFKKTVGITPKKYCEQITDKSAISIKHL